MKIVNKKKFFRGIIISFVLLFALSLFLSSKTFSHGERQYSKIVVSTGDTLWSIAQNEQKNNPYFENTDVRDIINCIKKTNNITKSSLVIGQEILIPVS